MLLKIKYNRLAVVYKKKIRIFLIDFIGFLRDFG